MKKPTINVIGIPERRGAAIFRDCHWEFPKQMRGVNYQYEIQKDKQFSKRINKKKYTSV